MSDDTIIPSFNDKNNKIMNNLSNNSISKPDSNNNNNNNKDNKDKIKDKKGRSTSCFLCQKRKQKCDQRLPSCTNCLKSKFQCIQPPRYGENNNLNSKNDDYTNFLEKKIKQLEKLLDLKAKNRLNNKSKKITLNDEKILKYKMISPFIKDPINETNLKSNSSNSSDSENDNLISLINQPYSIFININSNYLKNSFIKKYNLLDFIKLDPIINIDQKFSKTLISLYFRMLQYKFPLLNENEIFKFNEFYYNNNNNNSNDDKDFNNYHFNCSKMFLIYSISALLYKSTGKYKGPNPFNFFSTALRHLILLSKNLESYNKIELLILICFFLIRADKNSNNLYLIISDAMHCCINLSLHKSKSYENIDLNLKDLKMRKFWCCYILERSILISISKPFILHEKKIDSNLPLFNYEPSNASNPNNGKIFFINQSIKIKRLESKFTEDLSIINSNNSNNKSISKNQLIKVEKYFQDLQNWRKECQGFNNNGIENQTLLFYYYKSIRHLIQPYLELLDPNDKLFKECQAAAGQICQSIKNYHTKTFYGFSILNIHLVFIAGITLIYCLWLQRNRDDMRRKLLGDDKKHTRPTVSEDLFRGLDDLRACSISLYVMSERTKFALSFRDTFEEIMNATIGNLILRCGPDSSEILYRGIGLPPATFRKPLKHFQIDSNYIEKSDDDKLEEDERLKRKGHLTRSAIPKGLSHLLLHPPGFEDESLEISNNNNNNNNNNKNSDKIIAEKDNNDLKDEKKDKDLNNRILPLPIKLPQLQPQSRLSSSLSSKSFDNDLRSITTVNNNLNNNLPLKRKYSNRDSETESIVSTFSKQSPQNILSPLISSSFRLPQNNNNNNHNNNNNNSLLNSNINHSNHELSSTSTMSDKFRYLRSPSTSNIQLQNITSTATSSSSPDSTASMMNENFIMQNTIPDLFPFVGGTTTMISNISTWTEQSGQQIPQTGLTMLQHVDEPNSNGLNNNNKITTTTNNNNPNVLGTGNQMNPNLNHPNFHNNNNNNNSPLNHVNNVANRNTNIQSTAANTLNNHNHSHYPNIGSNITSNHEMKNMNSNNEFEMYNNNHNNHNINNTTYNNNSMISNNQHHALHQSNGMTETFNSLFDVVGNDDFWSLNNDLGFLP